MAKGKKQEFVVEEEVVTPEMERQAEIEVEKEKLLGIKKEVIDLKERTVRVLEKYNESMSDLLE